MRRYFLSHDVYLPRVEDDYGQFHYIDLSSHGEAGDQWNLIALVDSHIQPHENWIPFPPLYDSKTTLRESKVPESTLFDLGLTGEETCVEAAVKFGEVNPLMGF